jgi:tetratricopeptide (TPR) repeat protein
LPDAKIPRVIIEPSAMRSLSLSAADGFVLSRIDGKASEKDLASLTGLPEAQIRASLEKLEKNAVISFAPPPAPSSAAIKESAPKLLAASPAPDTGTSALLDEAMAKITDDTPELLEPGDIPVELRKRILGLSSVLGSLDHYTLLGIPRDVDKKGVKRAYFELAALFHPDRYFRKNLGSFKPKMEVVFAKVSGAYEVLSNKEQRAEYDQYLGDLENSRRVEAMLRNVMSEVETAEREVHQLAGAAPEGVASSASLAPAGAPSPAPARSAVADQLRREALAARLRGPRPMTKPAAAPAPLVHNTPARVNPAEAVEALRRRWEEKVEQGRRAQGKKYARLGAVAEERNDLTAAAAAYRVALTFLRPEDESYAHAREVIAKSEAQLGEMYMRQAEHEERANRWEDSARSWGRAAKLRPDDPRVLERLANALLHSNGDLHEAAQLAIRAITLSPMLGDYRCTLAAIYIAAGLMLNARRELEAAAQQFPDNPHIPILMRKLT